MHIALHPAYCYITLIFYFASNTAKYIFIYYDLYLLVLVFFLKIFILVFEYIKVFSFFNVAVFRCRKVEQKEEGIFYKYYNIVHPGTPR